MKIFRTSETNEKTEEYEEFKTYLLSNFYMWDKLPLSIKSNRKFWDIFLKKYPQFYRQIGLTTQDEETNKNLTKKWKGFILSNPDLMQHCPIPEITKDEGFLKEIEDFWIKELIEDPYMWYKIPKYVLNNQNIWKEVFRIKPSYRNFYTRWNTREFSEG